MAATESTEGEGAKSHDGDAWDDSEIVTLAVVREMMKIQESSYVQVGVWFTMTSLFNRPDNLTETVAGLKAIFHSCQSRANAWSEYLDII